MEFSSSCSGDGRYTRAGHGGEEVSKFTASTRSLQPFSLYATCSSVLVRTLTLVLLVHPQHTHAEEVAVQRETTRRTADSGRFRQWNSCENLLWRVN
jgi:hypothetical protein